MAIWWVLFILCLIQPLVEWVIVVVILFFVLGLRGSLITGLSVPIAFLISFVFIMWQGMTINSMVLFSLVLSLGLMVDNAIIVMEGINEYMYKYDKTPKEAALLSVWNYKMGQLLQVQ